MCVSGRMMIKQVVRKSNINNIFASMIITPTFKGDVLPKDQFQRNPKNVKRKDILKKVILESF